MHSALIVSGLIVVAIVIRAGIFYHGVSIGRELAAKAVAFEREGTGASLLVLGDSTGVGVGAARPEESIPGRMSAALSIPSVENRAVSGATVADLAGQIAGAKRSQYDYILILVGGNDIIRFRDASSTAALLTGELKTLPGATHVIVACAANVGGATLFPRLMRPLYERINLDYHARFAAAVRTAGFTYANLYLPRGEDPFIQDPGRYLAPDGLHPSSEGYRLWWERIVEIL